MPDQNAARFYVSTWLATWPVRMFGLSPPMIEIFALPIAAQEMILAVWLIVKGFSSSAIAS